MSRTTVLVARTDGDVVDFGDARNAWGSAVHIWDVLDQKYRRFTEPRKALAPGELMPIMMDDAAIHRLWHSLPLLDERDRWVLGYTFDRAIVDRENASILIDRLSQFNATYPSAPGTLGVVVALMERALENPAIRAICWQQTSVSEDVWSVYNEDEEESRPVNVDRDPDLLFWLTPESLAEQQPEKVEA